MKRVIKLYRHGRSTLFCDDRYWYFPRLAKPLYLIPQLSLLTNQRPCSYLYLCVCVLGSFWIGASWSTLRRRITSLARAAAGPSSTEPDIVSGRWPSNASTSRSVDSRPSAVTLVQRQFSFFEWCVWFSMKSFSWCFESCWRRTFTCQAEKSSWRSIDDDLYYTTTTSIYTTCNDLTWMSRSRFLSFSRFLIRYEWKMWHNPHMRRCRTLWSCWNYTHAQVFSVQSFFHHKWSLAEHRHRMKRALTRQESSFISHHKFIIWLWIRFWWSHCVLTIIPFLSTRYLRNVFQEFLHSNIDLNPKVKVTVTPDYV